jgi:quinoprotein glucose dehydrogenase
MTRPTLIQWTGYSFSVSSNGGAKVRRAGQGLVLWAILSGLSWGHPPAAPQTPSEWQDQGVYDPRLKGYFTPPEWRLEIVATEPVVQRPCLLAFGLQGELFVAEWQAPGETATVQPQTFLFRDQTRQTLLLKRKPRPDRIVCLRRGSGEQWERVAEWPAQFPEGLLWYDGWLYCLEQGCLRRYRWPPVGETSGKAGSPDAGKGEPAGEVLVRGVVPTAQPRAALSLGRDGWLYFSSGSGGNRLEGADGRRATVLGSAAVFRCRPDGTGLELFAEGLHQASALAEDNLGRWFQVDQGGGSPEKSGRLLEVVEGGDFGWRGQYTLPDCPLDRFRVCPTGGRPGRLRPLANLALPPSGGLCFGAEPGWPENYRGLFYYPDPQNHCLWTLRLEGDGFPLRLREQRLLLRSNDPLFCPGQLTVGPDGAWYVTDLRGGREAPAGEGEKQPRGRIYRLRPATLAAGQGPADSWVRLRHQELSAVVQRLTSDSDSEQRQALAELRRRLRQEPGKRSQLLEELRQLVFSGETPLPGRAAALQALASCWSASAAAVCRDCLRQPEPVLRRLAAEMLGRQPLLGEPSETQEALVQTLEDTDPTVRHAVVLALARQNLPLAADGIVTAWQFDTGKEELVTEGLRWALERLGPPALEKLLALADSGVAQDRQRVVEAFCGFRTAAAASFLPRLLGHVHLSLAERAALLRSYENYLLDPPLSLEPVAAYLAELPATLPRAVLPAQEADWQAALAPLRLAGLEVFTAAGPPLGPKAQQVVLQLLSDSQEPVRLAALRAVVAGRLLQARPLIERRLQEGHLSAAERAAAQAACQALETQPLATPK